MHVPTYHMEAGNRCFDQNVPEELNRRIVDHAADFNLAYTEHARRNLLAEGLHPRRVYVTGSPMREVLDLYRSDVHASSALEDVEVSSGEYFLVSIHREENVDAPQRLAMVLATLNAVAERWGRPVLVSTHPRTRRRLESDPSLRCHDLVRFHPPFGFIDYVQLQRRAACVLSDSGTIAEEATMMGFPAVTLRSSIERPEALDTGSIIMTDIGPGVVLAGLEVAMARASTPAIPEHYTITNTSERVVNLILSTAHEHRFWSGLR
jgi:UDP-N-acetylglucosamine 2-epimerase (non-hydrolysing)